MNISLIIEITQLAVAAILIFLTAIQGRGAGIKSTVGGSALYSTRRGAEKFIFRATIFFGILFASLAVASIFV